MENGFGVHHQLQSVSHPTRRAVALGLAASLAGCSKPPDLAPGESGRIARVPDGDILTLDIALRVRLVEIEAPAPGYDGRADEPFAAEARTLLTSAALSRTARLYYGGLSRDRYERALAHVIAHDETCADLWLNGLVVRQGAAPVRTFPDNCRRVRKLYDYETEARQAGRGLWGLEHWRVRCPDDLVNAPYFAIVEAPLLAVTSLPGDAFATLTPHGIRLETGDGLSPPDTTLRFKTGKPLRARGRVDTRSGEPTMRVTHWGQLETPKS